MLIKFLGPWRATRPATPAVPSPRAASSPPTAAQRPPSAAPGRAPSLGRRPGKTMGKWWFHGALMMSMDGFDGKKSTGWENCWFLAKIFRCTDPLRGENRFWCSKKWGNRGKHGDWIHEHMEVWSDLALKNRDFMWLKLWKHDSGGDVWRFLGYGWTKSREIWTHSLFC